MAWIYANVPRRNRPLLFSAVRFQRRRWGRSDAERIMKKRDRVNILPARTRFRLFGLGGAHGARKLACKRLKVIMCATSRVGIGRTSGDCCLLRERNFSPCMFVLGLTNTKDHEYRRDSEERKDVSYCTRTTLILGVSGLSDFDFQEAEFPQRLICKSIWQSSRTREDGSRWVLA